MTVSIRINSDIYNAAKAVATAQCRTIPGQIEYWAKVGKAALENPDLPIEFVEGALIAKNSNTSLDEPFESVI